MLKTLKFSKNWNSKLNNDVFSTIRKKGTGICHGDSVAVVLGDKVYKWVQVVGISECRYMDLSPVLLALDTGVTDLSVHGLFKQFGINTDDLNTEVEFLLLKSIPRPHQFGNAETVIQLTMNVG